MASMRDIKRRKGTIQSTQQITKAMKLVSTVKLQKARKRAEDSKPYFQCMYSTVMSMLARSGNINHPFLQGGETGKKAVVVVTSNRGLAGGYNVNVTKLLTHGQIPKNEIEVYAVGKKGRDILDRRGYVIKQDYSELIDSPLYKDAEKIGKQLLESFAKGEIGEIYLAYTSFKNTVTHEPKLMKLLPVEIGEESANDTGTSTMMNYEPEEEEALEMIIPKYITSIMYGAFMEAVASENGARMAAMDSATSNADDIISDLSLKFNRARQSSITQELTEIIAGAEAIS